MKRSKYIAASTVFSLLLFLCTAGTAQRAENKLVLPQKTAFIEAEAFCQTESIGEVVLPEGIEEIGARAFAESSLLAINLPTSLLYIADDAFAGCGELVVSVVGGTYAYDWAVLQGIIEARPGIVCAGIEMDGVLYNRDVPLTLYVGDTLTGCRIQAELSSGYEDAPVYLYSSSPESVSVVHDGEGVTIAALGDRDAVIYASLVQAQSVSEIAPEELVRVCEVRLPTYRALIIGNTYEGNASLSTLWSCANDAAAMQSMLGSMTRTNYQTSVHINETVDGMLAAISSALGAADENDVSLFYYSGHGATSSTSSIKGALLGVDGNTLPVAQLRQALDGVPGRKIVILDSCHSGAHIGRSTDGQTITPREFNASVISAFYSNARSGNLAENAYYVITAAHSTEYSYGVESSDGTINHGAFTYPLCKGSGWNSTYMAADTNDDGMISHRESYVYAYAGALEFSPNQHAQAYPTGGSPFVMWAK